MKNVATTAAHRRAQQKKKRRQMDLFGAHEEVLAGILDPKVRKERIQSLVKSRKGKK